MKSKILRRPHIAEELNCSLRHVYNLERDDPDFPRKIVFSSRFVGFRRESFDAYLQKKEADLINHKEQEWLRKKSGEK